MAVGNVATWGIHIDAPNCTIYLWTAYEHIASDREFAAHWPGWTVVPLGDAHEEHERKLDGIKLRRPWAELAGDACEKFEHVLRRGPRENPFLRLASIMSEHGHEIGPVPAVMDHVPATDFSEGEAILNTLNELESAELPPARFVDMHGTIHNT